ncbi:MAG: SAM-dependent methyltransferase, partial [Myxococcota bacterium]
MPLYIIGTPIGNLSDFSIRAIDIIKASDVILCESIERIRVILEHFKIRDKKIITYREENRKRINEEVLQYLKEG